MTPMPPFLAIVVTSEGDNAISDFSVIENAIVNNTKTSGVFV
jgi:hypothetical protein